MDDDASCTYVYTYNIYIRHVLRSSRFTLDFVGTPPSTLPLYSFESPNKKKKHSLKQNKSKTQRDRVKNNVALLYKLQLSNSCVIFLFNNHQQARHNHLCHHTTVLLFELCGVHFCFFVFHFHSITTTNKQTNKQTTFREQICFFFF